MTRAQTTKASDFDFYSDKSINLAELSKMMRDYGVGQQMMSKNALSDLLRAINQHYSKRPDLGDLDYNGFVQYVFQASNYLYKNEKCVENLQ